MTASPSPVENGSQSPRSWAPRWRHAHRDHHEVEQPIEIGLREADVGFHCQAVRVARDGDGRSTRRADRRAHARITLVDVVRLRHVGRGPRRR
jgi:hypothetical protein